MSVRLFDRIRSGVSSLSVFVAVVTPVLFPAAVLPAAETPPNVLFIVVDDLNCMTGFMGDANAKTPHMDRLAEQGTVFTNAYCQAPICGPSRASVMTGLYPHTTGIYGHINDEEIRSVSRETAWCTYLPEYFHQHGYITAGIGKLFHQHVPEGVLDISGGRVAGFGPRPKARMNYEAEYTQTDWGAFPERDEQMPDFQSARWAAEWLQDRKRGRSEGSDAEGTQPFFLAVGFLRPHVPWHVPAKWFERYLPGTLELPPYLPNDLDDVPAFAQAVNAVPMMPTTAWAKENGEWEKILQAYLACVTFADDCVGTVLSALEESGEAENTVIVLWSDHGYHLGEKNRFAKHALWREANQVPMIIAGPRLPAGQRVNQPVGLIDLYPTLIDFCHLPPNPQLEGVSLAPLIEDPRRPWDRPVLTSYGKHNVALTGTRYRYLRYEDGSEELYDLQDDPHEWKNLATDADLAETKARLSQWIPKEQADWAEKSVNDINNSMTDQKRRLGARAPIMGSD